MHPAPVGTGDRVVPVVRGRIKDLFKNLLLAMAGQEEAVHQIRVASRRLRVMLPMAALKPKGQRVKRAVRRLKELTRVAGESRDLDVALSLLPAAVPRQSATPSARAALARRLRAARSRARVRMVESLLDFDIAGLRKDLGRIVKRGGGEEAAEARPLVAPGEGPSRKLHEKSLEPTPAEILQQTLSLVGRSISVA